VGGAWRILQLPLRKLLEPLQWLPLPHFALVGRVGKPLESVSVTHVITQIHPTHRVFTQSPLPASHPGLRVPAPPPLPSPPPPHRRCLTSLSPSIPPSPHHIIASNRCLHSAARTAREKLLAFCPLPPPLQKSSTLPLHSAARGSIHPVREFGLPDLDFSRGRYGRGRSRAAAVGRCPPDSLGLSCPTPRCRGSSCRSSSDRSRPR
jgi:hypothetical protein